MRPFGTTVGDGFQVGPFEGSTVEVVVLQVAGRTLLVNTTGAQETRTRWQPLMEQVIDSLRFE